LVLRFIWQAEAIWLFELLYWRQDLNEKL